VNGGVVWLNGELLAEEEARISPFDHGLLTGDGVFETLRIYRGEPFAARRHLERLALSAAGMRLAVPDGDQLRKAMAEVIDANGLPEGRLRITVTGGPAPLGSLRGDAPPTVIVAAGPMAAWPPVTDVVTVVWPRNQRSAVAGLKTTSYAENVVALDFAAQRGAGEAIFGNVTGDLCEGTGTNVFYARRGRLFTPSLRSGCLAGVTRALLLELVDVVEVDMPVACLGDADEAFLTSSTREVQPIGAVDGRTLPAAPGPLTQAAARAFQALLERDLDP
jgi:branched-chain amino acid aminotransferase